MESILLALSSAFPTMAHPCREVVYQTLEKLIRERKVYQTSHGYFVITPETFRYMSSTNAQSFPEAAFSTNTLTLDALMTGPTLPSSPNPNNKNNNNNNLGSTNFELSNCPSSLPPSLVIVMWF